MEIPIPGKTVFISRRGPGCFAESDLCCDEYVGKVTTQAGFNSLRQSDAYMRR